MENKFKILVPCDFSDTADNAVSYASLLAKKYKGEIYLLNIVSKSRHIDKARERLAGVVEKNKKNTGVEGHVLVKMGSIFDTIGELALEIKASFIVMGTHGARGMQKITGSYVLKVICNTEVPYIIVQKKQFKTNLEENVKNIVLSVNYSKKSKQILTYVASLASVFGSQVHILYERSSGKEIVVKTTRELRFAKEYLAERKIDVITKEILPGEKGFVSSFLSYAKSVGADLLAAVNFQDDAMLPDFMGSREIKFLTNEDGIPTLILNPKRGLLTGGVIGS